MANVYRPSDSRAAGRTIAGLIGCAALAMALMGANWLRSTEPKTVSEVTQEIQSIVLRHGGTSVYDEGGIIGPWHVAASRYDQATGCFLDFRLHSGEINLAAATARLVIDAKRNSFHFELYDVVVLRMPDKRRGREGEPHLVRIDSFLLGPAEYHRPIIPDED